MKLKQMVRDAGIAIGLYRPGAASRFLNRAYAARFREQVAFFAQLVEPGGLCFDVGANIGEKSEALLQAGARVVAFEPQQRCIHEIEARCRPYQDRLTICQVAMGATEGTAELFMAENRAVSSLRQHWTEDAVTKVNVPVMTLDRAIERFGAPRYCKVDVEGWEYEVLCGLTQRIPLVSIEYHLADREIEVVRQCLERLQTFGDLRINITTAEALAFTQPEWLSAEQFLRIFPSKFLGDFQYRYGDIFVRTR